MGSVKKKPPARVVAIKGEFSEDVITQAELTVAAELQAAVWLAEGEAREAVQDIERRLKHGASIQSGGMTFDRHLKMARRKQRKDGSA